MLQKIGMGLVTVLDQLKLKNVIVLGDGAGANIALRYFNTVIYTHILTTHRLNISHLIDLIHRNNKFYLLMRTIF